MENKNVTYLSASDLLVNSGILLTILKFAGIIQTTPWQAIFQYWLALAALFMAELVIICLIGGFKWLIKKVAK